MREYFNVSGVHVLAHRGYARSTQENSLDSFSQALLAGATHIESDVHLTADGFVIMWHDETFNGKPISSTLKAELPNHVPTLDAALEALPEARFNVDIKSMRVAKPAAEIIKRAQAQSRVLIASFSAQRRKVAAAQLVEVAQSASSFEFAIGLIAAKLGISALVNRAFRNVDAIQIPVRALGMRTITRRTIRRYASAGVAVHVWTINDESTMRELIALGVDGIVTDDTPLAVATLRNSD